MSPLLGAVENMSGFVCPHCGERHDVFPRVVEERSLWSEGIERLAEIPLDPAFARTNGVPPAFVELARTLAPDWRSEGRKKRRACTVL